MGSSSGGKLFMKGWRGIYFGKGDSLRGGFEKGGRR